MKHSQLKSKLLPSRMGKAFLLFCLSISCIANLGRSHKPPPSTIYDGVTNDGYISYMNLNGTNGAHIQIPNSPALHQDMEYTIMVWFKPTSDDWGSRLQYAFKIKDSIECYFTESQSLVCESFEKCDKLHVSVEHVPQNYWTHLTISGKPRFDSYLSLETNTNHDVGFDNTTYVIMRQIYWNWYGCVGNCDSQYGFKGGLREFIFIKQSLTRETAFRIKNQLLSYEPAIQAYYRFNQESFKKDQYREQWATVPDSTLAFDFIPNDICSSLQDYVQVLNIEEDQATQIIPIDGRWNPDFRLYQYSVAIQLRIDDDSCYTANPYNARGSCNIFILDEAFMLYLDSKNSFRFYFFAQKNYYETQSRSIEVPQNSWLNIQMSMSRYGGYSVRVYDMRGKMLAYDHQVRDMYEQMPNRNLKLFQNFRGQVLSFMLMQSARSLPIHIPQQEMAKDWDVIAFWRFEHSHISSKSIIGQTDNGHKPISLKLTRTPQFEAVPWQFFNYNSGETDGLISYPHKLFDGITCNDDNLVPTLSGKNSYFKAKSSYMHSFLEEVTVEFWFKPQLQIEAMSYLFSMKENMTNGTEVMQIYVNTDLTLTCSPFGNYSVRNPAIKYTSYTELSRQEQIESEEWLHLACQFRVKDMVQGYLYSQSMNFQADEDISQTDYYFSKNTSYDIILGNNYQLNKGTRMRVKELRVWAEFRTLEQLMMWRYRQFDQSSYLPKTMIAYLRLTEGGHSEFNFANSFNSSVPRDIMQYGVTYSVDTNLVICPVTTYPINGRCYLNPVSEAVAIFVPTHNETDQSLSWFLSASHSILMNGTSLEELEVEFEAENTVIQEAYIDKAPKKYELTIPSTAFVNEDMYSMMLTFQNKQVTFQNRQKFTFVPNSCKYYKMNNSADAQSGYLFYNESQGLFDIVMEIVPVLVKPYCNEISFYKNVSNQVSYRIMPEIKHQDIKMEFRVNQAGVIEAVIPSGEQHKFPQQKNLTIIFTLRYENPEYKDLIDTSEYKFQDIVQTIYFNVPPQTVAMNLVVDKEYALKYELVTFDASATAITGYRGNDTGNLTFEWICPTNYSRYMCKDQVEPTLTIWSYQIPANGLNYSQYYEFTVKVTWHKPDGSNETFNATEQMIWYNVLTPQFTLYQPAKIKSTSQNIFTLQFDNYNASDLQNVSITWSIVPNLTGPFYIITNNDTELIVAQGGFHTETSYIITVVAQDLTFDMARKEKTIEFRTSSPPFDGAVAITPESGNMTTTLFTITIDGWQSNNEPIVYRAWYGESPNSHTPYQLIYNNWTAATENLTFYANTINSIIVEVSDNSTESEFIVLTPNITAQPQANVTSLISKAKESDQTVYQRQSYLNGAANTINSQCSMILAPSQEDIEEFISSKTEIIEELEKDIQKIQEDKSINSADSSHVIYQTTATLESIAEMTLYLNDDLVERVLQISNELMKNEKLFTDILVINEDFDKRFLNTISHIFTYIDNKAYSAIEDRRLADSSTFSGVKSFFQSALDLKEKYLQMLCRAQISSYLEPRSLFTSNIDLIVQKFRQSQDIPSRSFTQDEGHNLGLGTQFTARVNFYVNDLIEEAIKFKKLGEGSEICVQTSFLKVNPYPFTREEKKDIYQYSESFVDFKVSDETGEKTIFKNSELGPFTEVVFPIDEGTFMNNQTVCVTYTGKWDENYCDTTVDPQNFQAICDCNLMNSQFYVMVTDTSRLQGAQLEFPELELREEGNISSESSLAYLAIVIFLGVQGIVFTLITITKDKSDLKKCQEKIKSQFKLDILHQASKISNQPLGVWYYKQQDAFSYALSQNTLFTHLLVTVHPVLNFLHKFDFQRSRLSRFSLYFFQTCFFALISILWFGKQYRKDDIDRVASSIDQKDIDSILYVGLIGSILLLPLPVCFKGGVRLNQQSEVEESKHIQSSSGTHNTHNSPVKLDNKVLQDSRKEVKVVGKSDLTSKIITITLLCLSGGIIAAIAVLSQNITVANQQCMVASFYLGLMIGAFVTNLVRVILNYFFVESASKGSCLRFFTSSYGVEVYRDLKTVTQAENLLMEKLNFDNVDSQQLRQGEETEKGSVQSSHSSQLLGEKVSCNKVGVSDHSFDLSKSKNEEGLPEAIENYGKTQELDNKFKDSQDLDESMTSEKHSHKNIFQAIGKTPERGSRSNTQNNIRYSQVDDNQPSIR